MTGADLKPRPSRGYGPTTGPSRLLSEATLNREPAAGPSWTQGSSETSWRSRSSPTGRGKTIAEPRSWGEHTSPDRKKQQGEWNLGWRRQKLNPKNKTAPGAPSAGTKDQTARWNEIGAPATAQRRTPHKNQKGTGGNLGIHRRQTKTEHRGKNRNSSHSEQV
jgi:hypothetical protein